MLRPSFKDSDTGGPSLITVRLGWNTYLLFNTDIVNFVWKTDEGEAKSIVFVNFYFLVVLEYRWMRGDGGGQKVLFRAS